MRISLSPSRTWGVAIAFEIQIMQSVIISRVYLDIVLVLIFSLILMPLFLFIYHFTADTL